jgi:hypothetical protein
MLEVAEADLKLGFVHVKGASGMPQNRSPSSWTRTIGRSGLHTMGGVGRVTSRAPECTERTVDGGPGGSNPCSSGGESTENLTFGEEPYRTAHRAWRGNSNSLTRLAKMITCAEANEHEPDQRQLEPIRRQGKGKVGPIAR